MTNKHKRLSPGKEEYDPTTCKLCGMPEHVGRHHFVAILNKKPTIVCEPTHTSVAEHAELSRRNEMLREIVQTLSGGKSLPLTMEELTLAFKACEFWLSADTWNEEEMVNKVESLEERIKKLLGWKDDVVVVF